MPREQSFLNSQSGYLFKECLSIINCVYYFMEKKYFVHIFLFHVTLFFKIYSKMLIEPQGERKAWLEYEQEAW